MVRLVHDFEVVPQSCVQSFCCVRPRPALRRGAKRAADEALLGAYDAYRAGDAIKLARHAEEPRRPRPDAVGGVLAPVAAPGRRARPTTCGRSSPHTRNAYVAERLRGDWLRVLGKRARLGGVRARGRALHARRPRDPLLPLAVAPRARRRHARSPRRRRSGSSRGAARGLRALVEPMLWSAAASRSPTSGGGCACCSRTARSRAAKTALGYLPKDEAPDERVLAEAARQPKRFLARLPQGPRATRAAREVVVLAALRYARNDPEALASALEGPLGERLPDDRPEVPVGPRRLRRRARHHDDALNWYARADDTPLDDEQLAWKARAALRAATGRRCARRSTACRRSGATIRPGPTGTAARSPRRATRRARAPTSCASPASRLLRPARHRGARLCAALPEDARADRGGRRGGRSGARGSRARSS